MQNLNRLRILSKEIPIHVIVLAGFIGLCWLYYGFAFSTHGPVSGDEWYSIANSMFGHFPACLGTTNFINLWRPLLPSITCLAFWLFGPNMLVQVIAGVLATAAAALAWYAVLRNLFNLPASLGFVAGVFLVAFPGTTTPLLLQILIRLAAPAATLAGCWLVLTFWDNPEQPWRLILGCLVALASFLYTESLVGMWAIGLPLALLYKNQRWSWRWLWVSASILATFVGYVVWRWFLLPGTYTSTTISAGGGASSILLDPGNLLHQLVQVFISIFQSWARAFQWVFAWITDPGLGQTPLISVVCAVFLGLILYALARLDKQPLAPSTVHSLRPQMLIAALLSVPIMSLPYLFTKIDVLNLTYDSYGVAYGFSLALLAVLLAAKRPGAIVKRVAFVMVSVVLFMGLVMSIYALGMRRDPSCDFLRRFTGLVPKLPPDMYVIVKSNIELRPWTLSTMMGYTYYDGPTGVDHYDLGRHGYHGYLFVQDNQVNITPQGIRVNWAKIPDLQVLHPFTPLPTVIPPQQAVVVDYEANHRLSAIWLPHQLAQKTPEADAFGQTIQKRTEPFCSWMQQ